MSPTSPISSPRCDPLATWGWLNAARRKTAEILKDGEVTADEVRSFADEFERAPADARAGLAHRAERLCNVAHGEALTLAQLLVASFGGGANQPRWLLPSIGDSPPEGYRLWRYQPEDMVALSPHGLPLPENEDELRFPADRLGEARDLVEKILHAASYEHALEILGSFMRRAGIIEHFPELVIRHGSGKGPDVILTEGLLSSRELLERGADHSAWGQNIGDGIYGLGSPNAGWPATNTWGRHLYDVRLRDVDVLRDSLATAAFVRIYRAIRTIWEKPLSHDDSLVPISLPPTPYGINGVLSATPELFSDLKVDAVGTPTEILIKKRVIPPQSITYLGLQDLD